jgi:hypothetical protein
MRLLVPLLLLAGCGGGARLPEPTWHDRAEVVCRWEWCKVCLGKGDVGCGPCRAAGWKPCGSCRDGTQHCDPCKGDGSLKGKTCKACGGKGRHACRSCGGDQRVDCGRCSGKGRVHHLRQVFITDPLPEGPDAWPPR